jgi:hypothetical protein
METVTAYKTVDGVIHSTKDKAIQAQFILDFRALYNKNFKVDTISVHQLAGFFAVHADDLVKLIKSRDKELARLKAIETRKNNQLKKFLTS